MYQIERDDRKITLCLTHEAFFFGIMKNLWWFLRETRHFSNTFFFFFYPLFFPEMNWKNIGWQITHVHSTLINIKLFTSEMSLVNYRRFYFMREHEIFTNDCWMAIEWFETLNFKWRCQKSLKMIFHRAVLIFHR